MKSYMFHIDDFFNFISKCRLNLSNESVKSYLLSKDLSVNSMRLKRASIGFLFNDILNIKMSLHEIPYQKKEKSLPKVFSKEKINNLINSIENLKHRLIVKLFYSSGLRLQELIDLKRENIDFDRNLIHVRNGKGKKDRITILAESIKITPHMLRHSFATHLLEAGTDIRYTDNSENSVKNSSAFSVSKIPKNLLQLKELWIFKNFLDIQILKQHRFTPRLQTLNCRKLNLLWIIYKKIKSSNHFLIFFLYASSGTPNPFPFLFFFVVFSSFPSLNQ